VNSICHIRALFWSALARLLVSIINALPDRAFRLLYDPKNASRVILNEVKDTVVAFALRSTRPLAVDLFPMDEAEVVYYGGRDCPIVTTVTMSSACTHNLRFRYQFKPY